MGFFEKILVESIFLDINVWKENFGTVMVILSSFDSKSA